MATQKVYYCTTCQKGSQYDAIKSKINNLTTCFSNNEFITSSFYQKSYELLKEIQNFGEKDSNNPRLPNVDSFFTLEIKNLINELITHNFYDDIINAINNNSNSNKKNEIIYGTYWTSLKNTLDNINISNTKYKEKNCCDCDGYCSSDGWYCSYTPPCSQPCGECSGCYAQYTPPGCSWYCSSQTFTCTKYV